MKNKLFALGILVGSILLIWWLQGGDAALNASWKLCIPVIFIWFGDFLAGKLGDSLISFITLGYVCNLEGYQMRIFGWFWLSVQLLFWIIWPEVAHHLPASV